MKYYNIEVDEVLQNLNTTKEGLKEENLTNTEGKNKLETKKKTSNMKKFLSQFKDLMVIILILAAIISMATAIYEGESLFESFIIIAIVIINAVLGYIQEQKADKAIEELNKISIPDIKVRRNNIIQKIKIEDITIGDILIIEAGDYIPADCRIIESISLKVDEASLTGESISVEKISQKLSDTVVLNERINMIYSGSSVVYGKAEAVVTAIAMETELGKIAKSLIEEDKTITPLQKKINHISKILSIIIGIIIIVMFVYGISIGNEIIDVFIISISLAVAAIPEGLPAVITVTLSLGMTTLAKNNAIVRKISSVETLGSTQVICSDKTGTITQNKMTVKKFMQNNQLIDKTEDKMLMNTLLLCNDTIKEKEYLGDPTEIALYQYCETLNIKTEEYKKENPRLNEFPFDSERKLMTTINQIEDKKIVLTKGSIDALLPICSKYKVNNEIIEIQKDIIKQLEKKAAKSAYRILGLAYKETPTENISLKEAENNLIFIGFVCMIDPPRNNVLESIKICNKAGIKPIMITGDSIDTAIAIAKETGIYKENDKAIEGYQLDNLTEQQLIKEVKNYTVYARVSPEHKLRIVNAWQKNGKIVAMTGDGVNDAPAIKKADVGIGMGITGTEVSKNVADIVLTDDSFNTIIIAIEEGRNIYENIRKSIAYLLTANIAEVIIVFVSMLFGYNIFLPIHLLYINLVTDSAPAIALAFEKNPKALMDKPARENTNSIFTPFLTSRIAFSAIIKATMILILYFTSLQTFGIEKSTTMAFLALVLLEMAYAYTCRNLHKSILDKNIFKNKYMNYSILILIVIQLIVFATPIGQLFEIQKLNINELAYIALFVIIVFTFDEISKKQFTKIFKD